jgi:protein-tyrosine phosphatase
MNQYVQFIDIHCHILPALDDGPAGWDESLAMAEMAVADGIAAIVATPHQLGNYSHNSAEMIRVQTAKLQHILHQHEIDLQLLPGADVRIDPELPSKIKNGEVLTLADHRRYVLLELPHEVYIPLDHFLADLRSAGLVGILSHPERNQGIINQPNILTNLIEQGCLLQLTAGSLLGRFGSKIQKFSTSLIQHGIIDFIATDAHGIKSRPPLLKHAFDRVVQLAGYETAVNIFHRNPLHIISGKDIVLPVDKRRYIHNLRGNNGTNKSSYQFIHF